MENELKAKKHKSSKNSTSTSPSPCSISDMEGAQEQISSVLTCYFNPRKTIYRTLAERKIDLKDVKARITLASLIPQKGIGMNNGQEN